MTQTKVILNKVFTFDFTGAVSFGNLNASFLYKMFRDGRFCCEPLSKHLEQVFDGLEYVDQKGYDFIHPEFGKVEKKQITKSGLRFSPSSMIGVGRKVNYAQVVDHIISNDLTYVLADITKFPHVNVVFLKGTNLLDNCSSLRCEYSMKTAQELFIDATES